jgi:hypothetical protein
MTDRLTKSAALGLILGATLDITTTAIGLHAGLVETNPIGRGALDHLGLAGLLVLKTVAIFGLVATVHYVATTHTERATRLTAGLTLITSITWAAAAGWNATLILQGGGL